MRAALVRITAPTLEPVDLQTAKSHCRISGDDDDDLITAYITAAREYCEAQTDRAFLQQTFRLTLPRYPGFHPFFQCGSSEYSSVCGTRVWGPGQWENRHVVRLPRPRLIAVTSVKYFDVTGEQITLDPSTYIAVSDYEPAMLVPAPGHIWPAAVAHRPDAVQVTYTAGYGATAADVPAAIAQAILLIVGHLYENREATLLPTTGTGLVEIPIGVEALLAAETLAPSFD